MSAIEVKLVNPTNSNIVLESKSFPLVKGRLPLRDICETFRIKNPIWFDSEMELDITNDGLSTIAFSNLKFIRITGTRK